MGGRNPIYVLTPSGIAVPANSDALGNIIISNSQAVPFITQDVIRSAIMNKQLFSVTTGKIAASAVGIVGWQLFNNSTAKNALIVSLLLTFNSSNQHLVNMTTANVNTITGWTDVVVTPVNNYGGAGAPASLMTSSYSNTNITGGLLGTTRETTGTQNNVPVEILTNGECIFLPKAVASGVAIYVTSGAANAWSVTCTYIEN